MEWNEMSRLVFYERSFFSGKNKKNIISLSSAELAHGVLSVKNVIFIIII